MSVSYRYQSLDDFLISTPLTIDAQFDDGWGALFPVKGREIDATVLFADITAFTARTQDLTPEQTLFFVNNFLAWITAQALRQRPVVVDKYIGDEVMLLFSKEFGSDDPVLDAVQTARWISENDALSFSPHMGLASGKVIAGYVGSPLRYGCSVFGSPVAIAARCAGVMPEADAGPASSSIVLPAGEWGGRSFDEAFPPRRYEMPDGSVEEQPHGWQLLEPRTVELKNIGPVEVRQIVNRVMHFPTQSVEARAKEGIAAYRQAWLDAVRKTAAPTDS